MSRIVKIIKDIKGNDVEVYSSSCMKCNKEMVYPKSDVDRMENLLPFMKEKIEKIAICVDCGLKDPNDIKNIFSEEEIALIKKTGLSNN